MAAARSTSAAVPLSLCSRSVFQTTGKAGRDIARCAIFARRRLVLECLYRGQKKWASGGACNTTGALIHGAHNRTMDYPRSEHDAP